MVRILTLIMILCVPVAAFSEPIKLACYFRPPNILPIIQPQLEISQFWRDERHGLFIIYDPSTKQTILDSDLEMTASHAKIIPPSSFSVLGDEYIEFAIDMSWVKGVKDKYEKAEVDISINRYSLNATMILAMLERGNKPPLEGHWVRDGNCYTRKF